MKGSCSRPLELEEYGNAGEKDRATRRMSEPTVPSISQCTRGLSLCGIEVVSWRGCVAIPGWTRVVGLGLR